MVNIFICVMLLLGMALFIYFWFVILPDVFMAIFLTVYKAGKGIFTKMSKNRRCCKARKNVWDLSLENAGNKFGR